MTAECRIVLVGSRRDGGKRYWCLEHNANATAKYGRRAERCRYAHLKPVTLEESCTLDVSSYQGGVGLWGAVAPIYDTTRISAQMGVHVHARISLEGPKDIDCTFKRVTLINGDTQEPPIVISEWDAVYYMVASVFGLKTKQLPCTWCGYLHLDKDWFGVHPHQIHLCAGCGKIFHDTERGIGNPVANLNETLGGQVRQRNQGKSPLTFNQEDYPGGIQLWGSNSAMLWTNPNAEEEGTHLHAFNRNGELVVDDTFSVLNVDGLALDPMMARVYMAQSVLPHIEGRVVDLRCPRCRLAHFDRAESAFTPHKDHVCEHCGEKFRSAGRLRKTIGNPMVGILARLCDTRLLGHLRDMTMNSSSNVRRHPLTYLWLDSLYTVIR